MVSDHLVDDIRRFAGIRQDFLEAGSIVGRLVSHCQLGKISSSK